MDSDAPARQLVHDVVDSMTAGELNAVLLMERHKCSYGTIIRAGQILNLKPVFPPGFWKKTRDAQEARKLPNVKVNHALVVRSLSDPPLGRTTPLVGSKTHPITYNVSNNLKESKEDRLKRELARQLEEILRKQRDIWGCF